MNLHTAHILSLIAALAAFTGCTLKDSGFSDELGQNGSSSDGPGVSSDGPGGSSGAPDSTTDAQGGTTGTQGSTSGATDSTSGPPGTDSDSDGESSSSSGESGDVPNDALAACAEVDHGNCFNAALEVCQAFGLWEVTPECVAVVTSCYPAGTQALVARDLISFCVAELNGDCLHNDAPGCSETYCTCSAGGYPFDWTNRWDLTLVACHQDSFSDCAAVVDQTYPGTTVAEYEACRLQVMNDLGSECNCPKCGIHVQCEQALDACLAP